MLCCQFGHCDAQVSQRLTDFRPQASSEAKTL